MPIIQPSELQERSARSTDGVVSIVRQPAPLTYWYARPDVSMAKTRLALPTDTRAIVEPLGSGCGCQRPSPGYCWGVPAVSTAQTVPSEAALTKASEP